MATYYGARYQGPRNRGGWPLKKRTIFDTASRRRTIRALDILIHAQDYVTSKRDLTYDPADIIMDPVHRDAWELLQEAKHRVDVADIAAQTAAKAVQS